MSAWHLVKEVALFPRRDKRGKQLVRVAVTSFNGKYYGDIRLGYPDPETGRFQARRQGLTLNYWAIAQLCEALHKLLDTLDSEYGGPLSDEPRLRPLFEAMNQERADERRRTVRGRNYQGRACADDRTADSRPYRSNES